MKKRNPKLELKLRERKLVLLSKVSRKRREGDHVVELLKKLVKIWAEYLLRKIFLLKNL